jgi:hypothetical protein
MRHEVRSSPPGARCGFPCRLRLLLKSLVRHRLREPRSARRRAAVARVLGGASLGLILQGCAARNVIWLDPSSTAARVVFRVAQNREATAPPSFFYGLSVVTCGGRVMWTFGGTSNAAAPPTRIVYGKPATGYITREGPRPLRPGCYRAIVSGGATVQFRVRRDGSVIQQPSGETAVSGATTPIP